MPRIITDGRRKEKLTLGEWLNRVDFWVGREAGLGRDDLPDCCYADWHEQGISPRTAAKRALKAVGGE